MRSLLFISCLAFLSGCVTAYKHLEPAQTSVNDLLKFKPDFTTALYKTQVNVAGRYLSGLMMIKKMPDSSVRILFSNEMGFKFFDFGFLSNGGFETYFIISQMNKKAVIKTLRKDFELALMMGVDASKAAIRKNDRYIYYIFPQPKGFNAYLTDLEGKTLERMERSSKRKTIVEATSKNYVNGMPDSLFLSHNNFRFTISLKQLER